LKAQLRAAAVALPLGFIACCTYQMLAKQIGCFEAAGIYLNAMSMSVLTMFSTIFVFYAAGMLSLVSIAHFGEKAKRLLE
jgi:hypothetical protein